MRTALVVALLASSAMAQRVYDPTCLVQSHHKSRSRVSPCGGGPAVLPFLSFAAGGTEMGAPCAGTTPTTATGQALQFYRPTRAYCSKGNEFFPAVGDLVEVGVNVPRVMPGGDGTGHAGVALWPQTINVLPWSQDFKNAAWLNTGSGVPAPVVTANALLSPDGTQNAALMHLPAVGAGQWSVLYGQFLTPGITYSCSLYGRGVPVLYDGGIVTDGGLGEDGGNGSATLVIAALSGPRYAPCVLTQAWQRCLLEGVDIGANGYFFIGTDRFDFAMGATPTQDIGIWQADCQPTIKIGPPVRTDGGAALVEAERLKITFDAGFSPVSMAARTTLRYPTSASAMLIEAISDAGNYAALIMSNNGTYLNSATDQCQWTVAASNKTQANDYYVNGPLKFGCDQDGGHLTNYTGAKQATTGASFPTLTGVSTVWIGGDGADGGIPGGVVSDVCIDILDGGGCNAVTVASSTAISWIGDSITRGTYAQAGSQSPPTNLQTLAGRQVLNFGVNGDTASGAATRWADKIRGNGAVTLVMLIGVNDLAAGTSAATIYGSISPVLDQAKADGMRVVVVSVLPVGNGAGWSGAKQTQLLAYNALMSGWATTNSMPYVDAYTAMGQPGDATKLAAIYDSGDGVHPNPEGSAYLASLVYAAAP